MRRRNGTRCRGLHSGTGYRGLAGARSSLPAPPCVQLDVGARHRVAGHADAWQGGMGVAVYFGG